MKKIYYFGLVLCLAATAFTTQAQTLDEVIAKHTQAMGGADKIAQIKTMYTEGSLQLMGAEAPNVTYVVNGKGYRSETEFNGQKIIRVVTNKGGWQINPMTGGTGAVALTDDEFKMNKDQLFIGDPLIGYKEKGIKAELLGKEGTSYKVKTTTTDSIETTYFIDGTTYFITKAVSSGSFQGQPVQISTAMSDYQKTDVGFVIPHNVSIDMGGFAFSLLIKKIELNKPVDAALFDMPK